MNKEYAGMHTEYVEILDYIEPKELLDGAKSEYFKEGEEYSNSGKEYFDSIEPKVMDENRKSTDKNEQKKKKQHRKMLRNMVYTVASLATVVVLTQTAETNKFVSGSYLSQIVFVQESQEMEETEEVGETEETQEIQQEPKQEFLIWYDGDKKLTDLYWKWESDSEWKVVWEHQSIEPGTGADFSGTYKEEAFMVKIAFDDGEVGEAILSVEDVKLSKADADNMGGYLVYYIYPVGIWW